VHFLQKENEYCFRNNWWIINVPSRCLERTKERERERKTGIL